LRKRLKKREVVDFVILVVDHSKTRHIRMSRDKISYAGYRFPPEVPRAHRRGAKRAVRLS
jgi:hypothetical protein